MVGITSQMGSMNCCRNMMAELESVRPETPPLDPRQLVRLLVRYCTVETLDHT